MGVILVEPTSEDALRWKEQPISLLTKEGTKVQSKALVDPSGTFAYHKVQSLFTLTHVRSGFAIWKQPAPFAFRPLVVALFALPSSSWDWEQPDVLRGSAFAYNLQMLLAQWIEAGRLMGKVKKHKN